MSKANKIKKNAPAEKIIISNVYDILQDEDILDKDIYKEKEQEKEKEQVKEQEKKQEIQKIEEPLNDFKDVIKIKSKYITPLLKKNETEQIKTHDNLIEKTNEKTINYYNDKIKTNGEDLKLNSLWRVWVHENNNENWDIESYNLIYTIENISQLWRFLNTFDNMDRINRQFYIMRDGIMPIWEDNNNKNGVICSIRCDNIIKNTIYNSEFGVDVFSCFCIMVLNECFTKKNLDINGLCYSIKNRNILIKFWIKNYEENKNFTDKLPLQILNTIDDIIISLDPRKKNNKISIQVKQIQPEN